MPSNFSVPMKDEEVPLSAADDAGRTMPDMTQRRNSSSSTVHSTGSVVPENIATLSFRAGVDVGEIANVDTTRVRLERSWSACGGSHWLCCGRN